VKLKRQPAAEKTRETSTQSAEEVEWGNESGLERGSVSANKASENRPQKDEEREGSSILGRGKISLMTRSRRDCQDERGRKVQCWFVTAGRAISRQTLSGKRW